MAGPSHNHHVYVVVIMASGARRRSTPSLPNTNFRRGVAATVVAHASAENRPPETYTQQASAPGHAPRGASANLCSDVFRTSHAVAQAFRNYCFHRRYIRRPRDWVPSKLCGLRGARSKPYRRCEKRTGATRYSLRSEVLRCERCLLSGIEGQSRHRTRCSQGGLPFVVLLFCAWDGNGNLKFRRSVSFNPCQSTSELGRRQRGMNSSYIVVNFSSPPVTQRAVANDMRSSRLAD